MNLQPPSTEAVRRARGPRTRIGKRRSSMNALKHGMLSEHLILEGENRSDFDKLHHGLRCDFQPQGAMESYLVEHLAVLIWRRRRIVVAESGMISRSPGFVGLFGRPTSELPRPFLLSTCFKDRSTQGAARLGLVRQAIGMLFELHRNLAKRGFDSAEDLRTLQSIYGGRGVLSSATFCHEFMKRLDSGCSGEGEPTTVQKLVDEAIQLTLEENRRLMNLLREETSKDIVQTSHASTILSQFELDRMLRYETHISREFERTLCQLGRLQGERRGFPTPTIRVDLNS